MVSNASALRDSWALIAGTVSLTCLAETSPKFDLSEAP